MPKKHAEPNLIANPSLEDTHSAQPLAWASASWGDNDASFEYAPSGHSGKHSAAVTMTRYVSGDAKWYFDPVSVTPGTRYLFTDYYSASSTSFLKVRLTLQDGTFSYLTLPSPPTASTYEQAHGAFVAPNGATSATVFHGLASTGHLQLDDASLTVLPTVRLVAGVPNGDLEQEAYPGATLPAGWSPNVWGDNATTTAYVESAHRGKHALRVEVTAHTTGTASWVFEPQPVLGGQAYRVEDYYRSSAVSDVLAEFTLGDGTKTLVQLPVADPSPTWTKYSAKLYVPKGAATVTLYHRLSHVGFLETDDYSLLPSTTLPFRRGLVSLTFDDTWQSIYENALPVLDRHGMRSTQYTITGAIGTPKYMSLDAVVDMSQRGHQIAAHTANHLNLTSVTTVELMDELSSSKSFLEQHGFGAIHDFACPYGAYDARVIAEVMPIYQSHRTTDAGYNARDDFDVYRLKVQNIASTTSVAEVAAWADQASKDRSWLIIVYHDVVDTDGSPFSTTPAALDAQLTELEARQLPVVTVKDALLELTPQLTAAP